MREYNLSGLARIALQSTNTSYLKYFDNEYSRMNSNAETRANTPCIQVSVGDIPEKRKEDIHREVRFKRLFTFEYLVRDLETPTPKIFFRSHTVDKIYINAIAVFLQAQLLEPILYYKLLSIDILLMHAAGVTRNDKAFLLPAHGGTGKTTLSLRLASQGLHLLGDDLLLVDTKSSIVYPYPRPLHLFRYNLNSLQGGRIPFKYKIKIGLKDLIRLPLRALTKEPFLISTRVHAEEVIPNIKWSKPCPLNKIFYLKKSGENEIFPLTTEKEIAVHAEEIIASADLNSSFEEIICSNSELMENFRQLETATVKSLLAGFSTITYLNSRSLSDKNIDNLILQ